MKKFKFKKALMVLSLSLGLFGLNSCSGGILGGSSGLEIESVTQTYDEETETTTTTIVYYDEYGEKQTQTITSKINVKDGVGVENIAIEKIEGDTEHVNLVITYTEGDPVKLQLDIVKGDKGDTGTGIISVEKTESYGNVDTYTITYSDETTTTFYVTNGIDGIGVRLEIDNDYTEKDLETGIETHGTLITIIYDQEDENRQNTSTFIPDGKDGKDGKEIETIALKEVTDDAYVIEITYNTTNDNGNKDTATLELPRPTRGSKWFTGTGNPNSTDVQEDVEGLSTAIDQDMYINTANGNIFQYSASEGKRKLVFSLSDDYTDEIYLTLWDNDNDATNRGFASLDDPNNESKRTDFRDLWIMDNSSISHLVKAEDKTVISRETFMRDYVPTRPGYKFAGYATTEEDDAFTTTITDFTIFSKANATAEQQNDGTYKYSITLYARWEQA